MKTLNTLTHFTLLILLFFGIAASCLEIDEGDGDFEKFLENSMENYSMWMRENEFDPSPLTTSVMNGFADGVRLDCQLRNHYVIGHSRPGESFVYAVSNFAFHYFEVGKLANSLYELHGDFDCTGALSTVYFPELSADLVFCGTGKFIATSNFSFEYVVMRNVGITLDYKLDFTHSWPDVLSFATQKDFKLKAEWNETLISGKYSEDLENAFAYEYFSYPWMFGGGATVPLDQLLERYARELGQEVDLREILEEQDLPLPYVPTPRPRTAPNGQTN